MTLHTGSRSIQLFVKYCLDRVIALLLLLVLAPLLMIVAVSIRLVDHGPVFFYQDRIGLNRRIFSMWKFRTMIVDADRYLESDGSVKTDRITSIGKALRYLSLDELPQLVNILKGEMSFVGPRPALPSHLNRYTATQARRLEMKPGITGLAQIRGRNQLKWSKRIQYDIEYIDGFSLWLDLKILLATIKVVIRREGIVLDRNPEQVDDLMPTNHRGSENDT